MKTLEKLHFVLWYKDISAFGGKLLPTRNYLEMNSLLSFIFTLLALRIDIITR